MNAGFQKRQIARYMMRIDIDRTLNAVLERLVNSTAASWSYDQQG